MLDMKNVSLILKIDGIDTCCTRRRSVTGYRAIASIQNKALGERLKMTNRLFMNWEECQLV